MKLFNWSEPKEQSETKWNLTADAAIEKYGSATAVMEELFKDGTKFGSFETDRLLFEYLKEQYYKNER